MKFQHALIAVDFSPARERLESQLPALKALGVETLTLVHVLPVHYGNTPQQSHQRHYEGELQAMAQRLSKRGLRCNSELRAGQPATELERAAGENGAEIIIAGTRGHHPVRDFLLGSTALGLARHALRPLMLLPLEPAAGTIGDTLVVATDGSAQAASAERMAAHLQPRFSRTLALAVTDAGDPEIREQYGTDLTAHMKTLGERLPGAETRVLEGDPPRMIVEEAMRENAGLILLGKRGRNPVTELLLGSTAERVLRRSPVAVLMMPEGSA